MGKPPNQHDSEVSVPPAEKRVSDNNRRKGGKHCPMCLAPFGNNRRRTKKLGYCDKCQAHPTGKYCKRCAQPLVWENKSGAACQGCGLHGKKRDVIRAGESPRSA